MKKVLKFVLIPAMALSFSSCWTYKYSRDGETVYVCEWPEKTVYTIKKNGKITSRNIDDGNIVYSDTAYFARRALRLERIAKAKSMKTQ